MFEEIYYYFFISCFSSFVTGCLFTLFCNKIIDNFIDNEEKDY